ncbi:MAG: hypothetical protein IJ038_05210 [Clostridia bacterium]|nr:hypothetical protein [Clostridia bacterium]
MKKLICLIIIVILCLSAVSCQKQITVTDTTLDENGNIIIKYSNGETKTIEDRKVVSAELNESGELILYYSDETNENLGQIVEKYIYVTKDIVSLIKNSSQLETSTVTFGTQLKLVSESENGYSTIIHNGQEYYIKTEYTTKDYEFVSFNDIDKLKVFATENTILYKDLCKDYAQTVKKDTVLTQTGINKNNTMARVEYEGEIYYCSPSDLRA